MGKKVWYNYWQPPYSSEEHIYVASGTFAWEEDLLKVLPDIKSELMSIVKIRDGQLTKHYADEVNSAGSEWHTLAFKQWGIKVKNNLKHAPTLKSWLNEHPRILSSSVNILNSGAEIKEHRGDTDAIVRCHIGLEIPDGLPKVGFSVENEERPWKENETLIFRDAFNHKAWNNSSSRRVILVVDYILDDYQNLKSRVSINVRAFQILQLVVNKWKSMKTWPKGMHRFIFVNIKLILYILLPLQKFTGVLRNHS
ncbi:MAG: aspartyl/asparaginyl beta-hydroxylase (cupin superfamily) [Parvicellaceae bacterium]|jgi:aspartyl/asparaginyl beta-hydroxylase (cupin superfamily)